MKTLLKKLIGNKGCKFWYCRKPMKGYLEIRLNGITQLPVLPYCEYHGELAREVADEINKENLTHPK